MKYLLRFDGRAMQQKGGKIEQLLKICCCGLEVVLVQNSISWFLQETLSNSGVCSAMINLPEGLAW